MVSDAQGMAARAPLIRHFERNTRGRDIAVGDIHGCFTALQKVLDTVGFDSAVDRLFSVGDLIDRGPECLAVSDWLLRSWFHAVRGNHEDAAIRYAQGVPMDRSIYSRNGGDWFMALSRRQQRAIGAELDALPYAIEVETEEGLLGLVHADSPVADWGSLGESLASRCAVRERCLWDRSRITNGDTRGVTGVRAVVVGHTPLQELTVLGNVYHIDTMGWRDYGRYTLLDLASLKLLQPGVAGQ